MDHSRFLPVLLSASALLSAADPVSVLSPDGQVEIRLTAGSGRMSYADARSVKADPLHLPREPEYQGLDLPEVIRYAKQNGVGVLLYVNRRALERQLSSILPLCQQWGVAGVKFGFVNVGSQFWTKWLYDAVELAGKHRLMVDIHDEHRPTGLSRTYPHLMTQEGIAGNEAMPSADYNTVMPFTRFPAGATGQKTSESGS